MPSKYRPKMALPLRVPESIRSDLDDLVKAQPPGGAVLSRNSVAVAVLRQGIVVLRAAMATTPFALHAALVDDAPSAVSPRQKPANEATEPSDLVVKCLMVSTLAVDRAAPRGGNGWTLGSLAKAVGCRRSDLEQIIREDKIPDPVFRTKLWTTLRGPAPKKP